MKPSNGNNLQRHRIASKPRWGSFQGLVEAGSELYSWHFLFFWQNHKSTPAILLNTSFVLFVAYHWLTFFLFLPSYWLFLIIYYYYNEIDDGFFFFCSSRRNIVVSIIVVTTRWCTAGASCLQLPYPIQRSAISHGSGTCWGLPRYFLHRGRALGPARSNATSSNPRWLLVWN